MTDADYVQFLKAYLPQLGLRWQGFRKVRRQVIKRFHLILCRNLVFTYFAKPVQREILEQITEHLVPGGVLVVGKHESLPPSTRQVMAYDEPHGLYQRVQAAAC